MSKALSSREVSTVYLIAPPFFPQALGSQFIAGKGGTGEIRMSPMGVYIQFGVQEIIVPWANVRNVVLVPDLSEE